MKKLLLVLLLSLGLIGSTYASEKEVTLASECIEKIKEIDPNRHILPYQYTKFSHSPLHTITGSFSDESLDQDYNYCDWFGSWGSAIYGSEHLCAAGRLNAIEIIVSGNNRFNEAQKGVFVCAFRGCNYELDGIRVETSGRKYTDKKKKLSNKKKYNLQHLSPGGVEPC